MNGFPVIKRQGYAEDSIKDHFYGGMEVAPSTALFLFHQKGTVQQLLHQSKYRGPEETSAFLGDWGMGF